MGEQGVNMNINIKATPHGQVILGLVVGFLAWGIAAHNIVAVLIAVVIGLVGNGMLKLSMGK